MPGYIWPLSCVPTQTKNTTTGSGNKTGVMSGLKNSPFGKRLRASHRELTPNRALDPIFGISSTPSLSLDSSSTIADTAEPESPTKDLGGSQKRQRFAAGGITMGGIGIVREYGDRFVPSKDSGDLRTSYHLMEDGGGGPSTPSKSRIIPSESDALKGEPLSNGQHTEKMLRKL